MARHSQSTRKVSQSARVERERRIKISAHRDGGDKALAKWPTRS
jgi:hypothetical protein